LEIGHGYLLRRQGDVPDLRLQFDEVQAVEQVPGRYLRVIGKPKSRVIGIPEGIENFEQVLAAVSSVRAIEVRSVQHWQKQQAFMAASLILYVAMLWSTSPVVVISLSLTVAVVIVWLFVWIRRSPNMARGTKRLTWLLLPFLAICALKLLAVAVPHLPEQIPK
jgi:hypothetical protein